MFIDKVRLKFSAGKGGDGSINFEISGKPNGGDGGRGGDIILQGTNNLYDLTNFKSQKEFSAEPGEIGSRNKSRGANGQDLVIKVPLVTYIYNENNDLIHTIDKVDQEVLLAKGGKGGLGNHYFRRGQLATLNKRTLGKEGEVIKGYMELKLNADVAFIGFPNAGKSSMLNALSNSTVKVAPYPFTTLEPHLAVAGNIVLLDLPGLIEGTTEGKGLGTRFMKHVDNTKLIAHFISLESEDVVSDYKAIRKELEDINPELAKKEEVIILTKTDLYNAEIVKEKKKELEHFCKTIEVASIYDYDSLRDLQKKLSYLTAHESKENKR